MTRAHRVALAAHTFALRCQAIDRANPVRVSNTLMTGR
jgi:hypothetical protein